MPRYPISDTHHHKSRTHHDHTHLAIRPDDIHLHQANISDAQALVALLSQSILS